MTPTGIEGTTGPAYTDQEKDFLHAGAHRGLSAEQLAHKFAAFAKKRPGDFYPRSIASIQVKASEMGLSLATNVGAPQIAASGQLGIRLKPGAELDHYNAIVQKVAERNGLSTLTEVIKFALDKCND